MFLVLVAEHCSQTEVSALPDEDLRLLYERACETADPTVTRPSTAAAASIDRLRHNRLLSRMDGAGLSRAGTYALTVLGQHIVDFFVRDEILDAESLRALLQQIHVHVAAIRSSIGSIQTKAEWHIQVAIPLRTHVAALMQAIDIRGRTLIRMQEESRDTIWKKIKDHWASEVASYQAILESTTSTIGELKDIAIAGINHITLVLDEIEAQARLAGPDATEAVEAAQYTHRHMENVEAWARQTHEGWSAFFQHVQSYLRTVVQLDPGRVLEARLRDAARVFLDQPWALRITHEPSLSLMATVHHVAAGGPVSRPRRDDPPEIIEAQAIAEMVPLVSAALAGGASSVAAVLRSVLPRLPPEKRYAAIGRVGAILADRIARRMVEEPQWQSIGDGITVEDIPLRSDL